MIRTPFQFLPGMTAFDAQTASQFLGTASDHARLSAGLQNLQAGLENRGDNPVLRDLYNAVVGYRSAVQSNQPDLIASCQRDLAQVVGRMPDEAWRRNTLSYFEPAQTRLFHDVAYLADTLTALRHVAGSRPYTLEASTDDKNYFRTLIGGLTTFLRDIDVQAEPIVSGMVEEIGAQVQDAAVQTFFQKTGTSFPSVGMQLPAAVPSITREASGLQREAGQPLLPAPEIPPPPKIPDPPISQTMTSEPPTLQVPQLPFDYHPESHEELERGVEFNLQKVDRKLRNEGVGWPYDFIRWVRTLYALAETLPNGHSTRTRSNLTRGLTRLNEQTILSVAHIRRVLGPVSIAVGRPLEGLPTDWPCDMPNDLASALVVIHDKGHFRIASAAATLWSASAGLANEGALRGDLKAVARTAEKNILNQENVQLPTVFAKLRKILARIEEEKRPVLDLSYESQTSQNSRDSEGPESLKTIPAAEWVRRASRFLSHERKQFADPDDARPIALMTRRVEDALSAQNPSLPQAGRLLTLLFQLTITYRQLSGVSGEAALALGRESDAALTVGDFSSALETLSGKSSPRPEILQELADERGADPKSYASLLGPDGLTELVGRYVEYLRDRKPDALRQAAADFVGNHGDLGLNLTMVSSVLAYFSGLLEEPFDAALLKQVTEGVSAEAGDLVDIAGFTEAEQSEPLFRDLNNDKLTPFGMVFFKILWEHRPTVAYRPRHFMIYMERLSKIYATYWRSALQEGNADFDAAFDKVFENSTYARQEEKREKLQRFRQTYRLLFNELFQFLAKNPNAAEMVHLSLLQGETELQNMPARDGLHIAGGTTPAPEEETEEAEEAAPGEEAKPSRERPSEGSEAPPKISKVDEGVYAAPDTVSASGEEQSDNPFVFDHANDDLGLGLGSDAIAAAPDAPPASRPPSDIFQKIVSYWGETTPSKPLSLGSRFGRNVVTIDRQSRSEPMVISRPVTTPKEAEYQESSVTADGVSLLRYRRNHPVDIGTDHNRSVGDFDLLRKIVKAKGAVESGLRTEVALLLEAPSVTPRARRFFLSLHPNGQVLVKTRSSYAVYFAERTPDGPVEVFQEYDQEGQEVATSRLPLKPQSGDLPIKEISRNDLHSETERILRKALAAEGLQDSLWVALKTIGFLAPDRPDAATIIRLSEAVAWTGADQKALLKAKTALDSALDEIHGRFEETPPAPPANLARPKIVAAPAPVPAPAAKPAAHPIPQELEETIRDWQLTDIHREAIADMAATSSIETTRKILEIIFNGAGNSLMRKQWLEIYQQVVAHKRVTARGKTRFLQLMSNEATFGQVAPLLRVAAIKPLELVIDRLLPDPPLQLGRRYGRYVLTHDADNKKLPRVITRPAINADEGLCEERAVTADRASILTWTPRDILDIGINSGRITGPFHIIRMILKASGAAASGKRTNVHLVVFGAGVSPRARRFFFEHHPNGSLIVRSRNKVTVYKKYESAHQPAEEIREFSHEGKPLNTTRAVLPAEAGELTVKHIQETDWNADTHSGIVQPIVQAATRLEKAGKNASALNAARDQAIRAVGFLKPDHVDAAAVLEICRKLTSASTADKIFELQEDLERAAQAILARFDDAPQAAAAPATPAPKIQTTAAPESDAPLSKPSPESVPEANGKPSALPWTDDMRKLLERMVPELRISKLNRWQDFVRNAKDHLQYPLQTRTMENLLDYVDRENPPGAAAARELLTVFGRARAKTLSNGGAVLLIRIAGVVTGAIAPSEALPEAAPLQATPAEPADEAKVPWTSDIRNFLDGVWPHSQTEGIRIRKMRQPEEFAQKGVDLLRGPHILPLFENLNTALNVLPDRARAETLRAELEPATRGKAAGRLRQIFTKVGDTFSRAALTELVLFAAKATGALPAANAGPATNERGSNPPGVSTAAPNSAKANPTLAAVLQWTERASQVSNNLGSFTGFSLVRGEIQRLLGENPETALLTRRLSDEKPKDFPEALKTLAARGEIARELERLDDGWRAVMSVQSILYGASEDEAKYFADLETTVKFLDRMATSLDAATTDAETAFSIRNTAEAFETLCRDLLETAVVDAMDALSKDVLDTFEGLAARFRSALDAAEFRLLELMEESKKVEPEAEPVHLPPSPPGPMPAAPILSGRRFQISPTTPQEILDILATIPPDRQIALNAYPEIALLAPDHEVYGRLFKILALRKAHGPKGAYIAFEVQGRILDGYATPPGVFSLSKRWSVVDTEEKRHEVDDASIMVRVDFDRIDPVAFEAEVRDPQYYDQFKISYYCSVMGHPPAGRDRLATLFRDFHEKDRNASFFAAREINLIRQFQDPAFRRLLMEKIASVVSPSAMQERIAKLPPDVRRGLAKSIDEDALDHLAPSEKTAFAYLHHFIQIYAVQNVDTQIAMLDEILGMPLERNGSDLKESGWTREQIAAWQSSDGQLSPELWASKLDHARALSTPEKTHLIFAQTKVKAVAKYVASARQTAGDKVFDEVTGEAIPLPEGGKSFRLLDPVELPESSWHRVLLTRLRSLGDRPSPVLDLVISVFDNRFQYPFRNYWRDLAGLIVQDADSPSVSSDDIRRRVALWAVTRNEAEVRQNPQFEAIFLKVRSASKTPFFKTLSGPSKRDPIYVTSTQGQTTTLPTDALERLSIFLTLLNRA